MITTTHRRRRRLAVLAAACAVLLAGVSAAASGATTGSARADLAATTTAAAPGGAGANLHQGTAASTAAQSSATSPAATATASSNRWQPATTPAGGTTTGAPGPLGLPAGPHRAAGAATTEPGHPAGLGSHCNDFDTTACLLPFPSDWWTRPDPTSATGRRVAIPTSATPRNLAGLPITTTEWNRRDGFSVGTTILVHVPGLDSEAAFKRSGIVPVTDIGAYADPAQPVVLLDAATGQRWPIWAEVDVTAKDPATTLLMIHPAVNLDPATRYVVVLRNLRAADGQPIPPPGTFNAVRATSATATNPRAAHLHELLTDAGRAGIDPASVYLTWDFTTASDADTTGRLLSMRNRTFAQLGDTNLADGTVQGHAPAFHVASVQDRSEAQDPNIARQVVLNVTVPCFIWPTCTLTPTALTTPPPALQPLLAKLAPLTEKIPELGFDISQGAPDVGIGRFLLDANGMPRQNPLAYQARVVCNIPRRALTGPDPQPSRLALYGHGLLGSPFEIDAGNVRTMAQRHDITFCATDWLGMAAGDIPNALLILADLGRFPSLVDRMQQGLLDALVTGRAMIAPGGFATNPAFQVHGRSAIDTSALYYDGNSQGGIYGGTLTAVEPDVRHAVLGVPGMDFSLLVYRSSDFATTAGQVGLETPLLVAYPSPVDRLLGLDLVQMLWDRADPDGYAAHLTNRPLPNTPTHEVLLQMAFGDHQVANIATETEARTAGLPVLWPALQAGRSRDTVPYWGLRREAGLGLLLPAPSTPLGSLPALLPNSTAAPATSNLRASSLRSALVVFDSGPVRTEKGATEGVAPPPPTDTPDTAGADPHEDPRATDCGQQQKSAFLLPNGRVTTPCGGPPYFAGTWTGR